MIESALEVFKQNTHFMIATKEVVDSFYGKNDISYSDIYDMAVVVPHGYSLQEASSSIGVDSYGKIDVYTKTVLKSDDLVEYNSKMYIVTETSKWDTTLGSFSYYVCQIQI